MVYCKHCKVVYIEIPTDLLGNKIPNCRACGNFAYFVPVEAAQQIVQSDERQESCELGGVHEFAPPVVICSKCGTRR